jgi:hypothetical protein
MARAMTEQATMGYMMYPPLAMMEKNCMHEPPISFRIEKPSRKTSLTENLYSENHF